MPQRYWSGPLAYLTFGILLAVIVYGLVWNTASTLAEQRVRAEKTAEYHQSLAEQNITEKCVGLKLPALRDCVHEQIETARDHERSEQDLDAQQQMALFTRIMGITALLGIVLGLGSVVLIYATLRSTQKMALDTREIGDTQNRPWIKCSLTVPAGLLAAEKSLPFGMQISVENIGSSAANRLLFDVFLFQDLHHADEGKIAEARNDLINRAESGFTHTGVILPGETVSASRAEALVVEQSPNIKAFGGVLPAACVVAVYRFPSDSIWHCTATIFDLYVADKSGVGLGHPFRMDGKAIPGDAINVVMRRNAIGT